MALNLARPVKNVVPVAFLELVLLEKELSFKSESCGSLWVHVARLCVSGLKPDILGADPFAKINGILEVVYLPVSGEPDMPGFLQLIAVACIDAMSFVDIQQAVNIDKEDRDDGH